MKDWITKALLVFVGNAVWVLALAHGQPVAKAQPPDFNNLNRAFILTGSDVTAAVIRGEEAAKKHRNESSFLNGVKTMPEWIRGKKGHIHQSAVWCYGLYGMGITDEVYRRAVLYESMNIPDTWMEHGIYLKSLLFRVFLCSAPHPKRWLFGTSRLADEQDVHVVKFVLSDDEGHYYTAKPGALNGMKASGAITYTWMAPVYTYGGASGSASVFSSEGSAFVTGRSSFWATQFIPQSSTQPYYTEIYHVAFNLFNKDGTPRIDANVNQITLHIITEDGEQDVKYNLR